MIVKTPRFIRRSILVLCHGVAIWFCAETYFRRNWGHPLALALGLLYVMVLILLARGAAASPAPFQLVLRLAGDKDGNEDDDSTFEKLHGRFTNALPGRRDVRFAGFDTDGHWIWFYFYGPNEQRVREAVLSQLQDCKILDGSYFLSAASQPCAPPNDGPALQLWESPRKPTAAA